MRKKLVFFLMIASLPAMAQKFGYVDTDYVLRKMPEYSEAQAEVDKLTIAWQDEIIEMSKEIDKMYNDLQAEEVLLTPEMKKERLALIEKKEEELKVYQKKIFGFEGLLFLKKKELIKPIQDKVFEAVDQVAKEEKLAVIFDKAGDLVMIYTDPRHDYTDFVLEALGLGDPNDYIEE